MFLPVIDNEAYNLIDAPLLTGTPERRLILAMLERAILDYVGNDQLEVQEAEAWIFGDLEETALQPFTFPWVCQHLDLDAVGIARTIRAMPRRGNNRVAPWYFTRSQSAKKEGAAKSVRPAQESAPHRSELKRPTLRLVTRTDKDSKGIPTSLRSEKAKEDVFEGVLELTE